MTARRISVTRLRHLQPSVIASLLQKGLAYDTGRKRWCRRCRTFEIVLALTPAGMAERELADMLTADGRRLTRRDALNEVQKPLTSSFGLFDVGRRYPNSGSPDKIEGLLSAIGTGYIRAGAGYSGYPFA